MVGEALAAVVVMASAAWADIYLESKMSAEEGEKPVVMKQYYTADRMRMEMPQVVMITRLDKGLMWVLMSEMKMYQETTFEEMKRMVPKKKEEPKAPEVRVELTDQTQKIAGYEARLTKVWVDGKWMDWWVSPEVDVTDDFSKFAEKQAELMADVESGTGSKGFNEALLQVKGFPLKQVYYSDEQGTKVQSVMEVIKVEKNALDEALFEIPEGYQKFSMPQITPETQK